MKLSGKMPEHKIANAVRMRRRKTPAEMQLVKICEEVCRWGGDRFGVQVPMLGYICDIYFHGAKMCIEADGGYHVNRSEEDDRRDSVLMGQGVITLRFRNETVLNSPREVQLEIFRVAKARNPGWQAGINGARKQRLAVKPAKRMTRLQKLHRHRSMKHPGALM